MKEEMITIIDKLKPYLDKIYLSPLSIDQVNALESQLNIQFPEFFKTYLTNIGLLQDLVGGNIFQKAEDYIREKEFILDLLKEKGNPYFAFSQDGFGNLFVLKDAKSDDAYIYVLYHDTGKIVKKKETFIDFLDKAVNKSVKQIKKRKLNSEKSWQIQLTFETDNEKKIIDKIQSVFQIKQEKEWVSLGQLSSGVITYEKEIVIDGTSYVFKKSEYKDWDTPLYAIDFSISVFDKQFISDFERLDAILHKSDLGYKLISYGIF